MSVKLYMDEHVPMAVVEALRLRGADVLTAQEDGATGVDDPTLLDRATHLGRVLFTQDRDFLIEGARRQERGERFAGIVFAQQGRVLIGGCVRDLELISVAGETAEFENTVTRLPL